MHKRKNICSTKSLKKTS